MSPVRKRAEVFRGYRPKTLFRRAADITDNQIAAVMEGRTADLKDGERPL
jgi:hypothetical protein